jgi:hypothetical protein
MYEIGGRMQFGIKCSQTAAIASLQSYSIVEFEQTKTVSRLRSTKLNQITYIT